MVEKPAQSCAQPGVEHGRGRSGRHTVGSDRDDQRRGDRERHRIDRERQSDRCLEQERSDRQTENAAGDHLGREQQALARGSWPASTSIGRNACAELSNSTSQEPTTTSRPTSDQIDSQSRSAPTAIRRKIATRTRFAPTISGCRSKRSTATPMGRAERDPRTNVARVISDSSRSSSVIDSASSGIATNAMPSPRLLMRLAVH